MRPLVQIRWCTLLGIVGAFGLFCFLHLPRFVQGGDTGELVSAAYRLFVPHPPGYPLWVWVQHFLISAIPGDFTVFWKASAFGGICGCATLLLLGVPLVQNIFSLLVCLPILALSTVFLEAVLLPDVFSFHAVFIAMIGNLYFFSKKSSKASHFGIPFLFCLGLSHHLTIGLLAPVVVDVFYGVRKNKLERQLAYLGLFLGVCATIVLYLSLLMLNTESPYSWDNLEGPLSVWRHFLRSDYGTFRLAAVENNLTFEGVVFFFKSISIELVGLLGISILSSLRLGFVSHKLKDKSHSLSVKPGPMVETISNPKTSKFFQRKIWIWSLTCFLSVMFFMIANVSAVGMGEEILRRFCLMPLVQVVFLIAFILTHTEIEARNRWVIGGLTLVVVSILMIRVIELNGLQNDAVFEDYAFNLLKQGERHKPAVIITANDNAYFSLRYVQTVFGKGEKIAVVSPSLFFHPWYLNKIQQILPKFRLSEPIKIWTTRNLDLNLDLIDPNIQNASILVQNGYQDGKRYHVTFLGLDRILSLGSHLEFDEASIEEIKLRTSYENRPIGPQSFSKGLLFSEYSSFFLARGLFRFSTGHLQEALQDWKTALKKVPYAVPALINICRVEGSKPVQSGRPNDDALPDEMCSSENLDFVRRQANGFF